MIYYNQKNKKSSKFKRIIILISVLIVLPAFFSSIQGDTVFFANNTNSKENFDIPSLRDSSVYYEDTNGHANGVFVSGDYAYVADGNSGLAIIDISDPTNPGTPVYEDTTGNPYGVFVSGDYAYVADYTSGLAVIDISDPTNPGTPVYEDTTGYAWGVYVSGDYAYVADFISGLAIIDISDPTNPGTPVYENTTGSAIGVYVSGDYAYIADWGSGLAVIDISDPTNPGTPVYEDTIGNAFVVYVSGDYAYVADGYSGLAVIDISDPTNPGTPFYEDTTGDACGVFLSGDYAYIANWNSGLAVIDISDPTNPGTPVYEDTTGYASGVFVSGDYAYIADYTSGLAVIDISESIAPGTPVYEYTNGDAYGVYVSGDYAYMADYDSGLAVIQMEDPIISDAPSDFTMEYGYTGQSISWTATDANPDTYKIELQGTGIVAVSTAWTSGNAINYSIPDGFGVGSYIYTVNFTEDYGNFITDSVTFTVEDTTNPVITVSPNNFTVEYGYTVQSISWTATDANPDTYTIKLIGTGIVVTSTPWADNTPVVYNIPDSFAPGALTPGVYTYNITFTDESGNSISNTVTVTINLIPGGAIPFGNSFLIFIGFSVICLIFTKKRQIDRESR